MTENEIQDAIFKSIKSIAPEAELNLVDPHRPIRDQIDLDSMDFFNVILNLHSMLGVDIPESDYPKLTTLGNCISYLQERTKQRNQ